MVVNIFYVTRTIVLEVFTLCGGNSLCDSNIRNLSNVIYCCKMKMVKLIITVSYLVLEIRRKEKSLPLLTHALDLSVRLCIK